ncbi:hypothetical protein ID867_18220 [Streptomyces parvulus]|nr:hypothetical protein [Streptomyces parvulus]
MGGAPGGHRCPPGGPADLPVPPAAVLGRRGTGRRRSGRDAGSAGDEAFWAAVQDQEFDSLAGELGVDGDALSRVLPALRDWRRKHGDQATVDGWRRRIAWRPLNRSAAGTPAGTWLAVLPRDTPTTRGPRRSCGSSAAVP